MQINFCPWLAAGEYFNDSIVIGQFLRPGFPGPSLAPPNQCSIQILYHASSSHVPTQFQQPSDGGHPHATQPARGPRQRHVEENHASFRKKSKVRVSWREWRWNWQTLATIFSLLVVLGEGKSQAGVTFFSNQSIVTLLRLKQDLR
jgi:hypothetical protein